MGGACSSYGEMRHAHKTLVWREKFSWET